MKPGQDGLFQALLERCPGLQIAVCTCTAQSSRRETSSVLLTSCLMLLLLVFPFEKRLTVTWRNAPFQGDKELVGPLTKFITLRSLPALRLMGLALRHFCSEEETFYTIDASRLKSSSETPLTVLHPVSLSMRLP